MRRTRPFAAALAAGLSLAVAGLSLVAAGSLLGAVLPALDLINHAAPALFLASAVTAALAAWMWRKTLAQRAVVFAGAGFALLVFGLAVLPEVAAGLFSPRGVAREGEDTLTVASMNVWNGGGVDPDGVVEWLLATDADILLLQETNGIWREQFAPLREAYPYVIPSVSAPFAGAVILSRHAPISINARAGAAWDLTAPGGPPRSLRWVDSVFEVHGRPVPVASLHARRGLAQMTGGELDAIASALQGAGPALIVAGDFNMTPWTHTLRRFEGRLGLARASRNMATFPTPARGNPHWPPGPVFAIDHQMYGPAWRLVAVERGPQLSSDHYPVVATYAWRS